jgi:hypothetical protein
VKILKGDKIYNDIIPALHLHNLYVGYSSISKILKADESILNKHSSTVFIEQIKSFNKTKKELPIYEIYLNVFHKDYQIAVFKNEKLQLFNQFEFETVDEFLYYLFFIVETMKIEDNKTQYSIMGINPEHEIIKNLKDFTSNIYIFPEKIPGQINNFLLDAN